MVEPLMVGEPMAKATVALSATRKRATCSRLSLPQCSHEEEQGALAGTKASITTGRVSLHKNDLADAPSSVTISRRRNSVSSRQPSEPRQQQPTDKSKELAQGGSESHVREGSVVERRCCVVVQHAMIEKASNRCASETSVKPLKSLITQPSISGSARWETTGLKSHGGFPLSNLHRFEGSTQGSLRGSSSAPQRTDRSLNRCRERWGNRKTNSVEVNPNADGNDKRSSLPCSRRSRRSSSFALASGEDGGLASLVVPCVPLSSPRRTKLEGSRSTPMKVTVEPKSNSARHTRVRQKVMNLSLCKYPLLRIIAEEHGFKTQETEEELEKNQFNLIWSDTVLPLTRLVRLANWQRTNHFPSMYLLCRKGHLGITLSRIRKLLPALYMFYPRTWSLRSERHQFTRYMMGLRSKKLSKFFILKPNSGCQGRGIVVTRDPMNAVEDMDNYIVQEYITKPLLLEGRKFDLRVYVLLTSIRAPSIFLFNDGLVRLCAEMYEKPTDNNVRNTCKHLTNYAVNKNNPEFVFNEDSSNGNVGNKRNFAFFNEWIRSSGMAPIDFWDRVSQLICKTVLVAQPQIANVYNTCFPRQNDGFNAFEVLGFDILIDHKMKPWLMEVNHTPSLATDTPLDYEIKHALITEVLDILDVKSTDRRREEKKSRDEFLHRVMRPTVNRSAAVANKSNTASERVMSSSPSTCSLLQVQSLPPTATSAAVGTQDQAAELVKLVEERRAHEDSKLRNFRRIYPSKNPEHQSMYDVISAQAHAICPLSHPNVGNSTAPLSPQAVEDRQRRSSNNTYVDFPSALTAAAVASSGCVTESTQTGTGTDLDSLSEDPSRSSKLSRMARFRKPYEDMMLQNPCNERVAPHIRPLIINTDTTLEIDGRIAQKNVRFSQVFSQPSSSIECSENSVDPKQKPSIVEDLSVASHTTVPEGSQVALTAFVQPSLACSSSVVSTTHPTDRLDELRNLQEQLDHHAECEHSQMQDTEVEHSFTLDE